MKTFGVVAALSIIASVSGFDWTDLRVKWVPTATATVDSYYKIPRTACDAVAQGWVLVPGINSLNVTAYCLPNDVRYCILLDGYGHIAGIQIGILVSDIEEIQGVYNMTNIRMIRRKQFFGQDVWTSTFYVVDPQTIQAGGRENWNNLTGTEGVWFETKTGYLALPRYTKDLDSVWTRATCLEQMGTHFYFNSSKTQDCATISPLFPMYDNEELSSVGWFVLGSTGMKKRPWVEKMPEQLIELLNPTGPTCLYDGVQKYGILSIHTYFAPKPWKILCPLVGPGVRDQLVRDLPKPGQKI